MIGITESDRAAALDEPLSLSAEQISAYQRDGFIRIKNVLPAELLEHYRAEVTRVVRAWNSEMFIDQYDLVASTMFVLDIVVCLRGYSAGCKNPFLQVWTPIDGFVDQVSWSLCSQDVANKIVLSYPRFSTNLTISAQNTNPQIVCIGNTSIRTSILFAHTSHVQFSILDSGPLPFHSLVGITSTFSQDEARNDKG